jgi:methionyl-tRNA synthetase
MDLAQYGNQYFDAVAPWSLIGTDKDRCGTVLHISMLISKALAVMAWPILPYSSESIWNQLGMDGTIGAVGWKGIDLPLKEGARMEKPVPQFAKVDVSSTSEFSQFSSLDLKVGKVLEITQHPNADKLYLMKIDIGRPITIVSGLKEFYTAEELSTKTLVIVTNLEPATIRGVKSEGMLLAAEEGGKLALVTPEKDVPAGTPVSSGIASSKKQISFKEFQKLELRSGLLVGGEQPVLDLGSRKLPCTVPKGEPGRMYAAFVQGDRALVLHTAEEVKMVFDRDIQVGAKIR